MTAGSGFLAGELKDLSYDRLVVATAEPMPVGHRTIVYLADAVTGVEYTLPCVIASTPSGRAVSHRPHARWPATALALHGAFVGLWRSPLGIGRTGEPVEAAIAEILSCSSHFRALPMSTVSV